MSMVRIARMFVFTSLALALALSAGCAPVAHPDPQVMGTPLATTASSHSMPTPGTAPTSRTAGPDVPPAQIVRQALAQQLHVAPAEIKVVRTETMDWPDSCLGAPAADEMCAQVVTPGYRLTFEFQGHSYVYHTDAGANHFRLVSAPEPVTGEPILTWTGRADDGTCRQAVIGVDGVAVGRCGERLIGGKLALESRQPDLATFAGKYASFEAETPAGKIKFTGYGASKAAPSEQRMLAEWARLVQLEAQMGRSGASWGLALAWSREGGIAGFCDNLTVDLTGDAYASTCKAGQAQTVGRTRLSAEQLATLYRWVDGLQAFKYETKDPATADAMTTRLDFTGAGQSQASAADREAMQAFAAQVYAQASEEPTGPAGPTTTAG